MSTEHSHISQPAYSVDILHQGQFSEIQRISFDFLAELVLFSLMFERKSQQLTESHATVTHLIHTDLELLFIAFLANAHNSSVALEVLLALLLNGESLPCRRRFLVGGNVAGLTNIALPRY